MAVRVRGRSRHAGRSIRLWRRRKRHDSLGEIRPTSSPKRSGSKLDRDRTSKPHHHAHLHHQRQVNRRRRRRGLVGRVLREGGPGLAGRSAQISDNFNQYGCCQASFNNNTVGWFISCAWSSCSNPFDLDVGGVDLTVNEVVGPWLAAPSGLWQAQGWVRGDVVLGFYGDSPSGVCGLGATINGQIVATSNSPRNQTVWHQCNAPPISQTLHTIDYGQGAMPLTISGLDAAGVPVNYTKTIRIDNEQPTVALSGSADAASTAGTQYVTATATAGPSGVAGISCAVDGAAARWYPSTTAQVPVDGVGQHQVQRFAENNARDGSGAPGVSAMRSFSMSIRVPTISGIAFTAIADRLRCHRVEKRIRVPARTVIVRRHHKRVRVRRPAHIKIVHVTKCHPRIVVKHRIVVVTIHRHGKGSGSAAQDHPRGRPAPPRAQAQTEGRLRPRHDCQRMAGDLRRRRARRPGGRRAERPRNGGGSFTPVAWATTASNGGWTAQIPAGPSRLIEADYGGAANVEPSLSGQVTETVPAKVKLLRVVPRRVAWGKTVRITGQLVGGYLPSGGALVRLRIGLGSAHTTYGVQEHVTGSGRFSTTYTFGAGTRDFTARTGSSSPRCRWATIRSRRRTRRGGLRVGGHPPIRRAHRRGHHRRQHPGPPVRADDRQSGRRRPPVPLGPSRAARVRFARRCSQPWLALQYHIGMVDSS